MKIIMISTDLNILRESPVRERMKSYGALADELHIFVVGTKKGPLAVSKKIEKIADNVWLYPTLSVVRPLALLKLIIRGTRLAKRLEQAIISAQDPFEQGLAAYLIARLARKPLQFQIHTDLFSPYFASSKLNRMRLTIARSLLPKARSIRVVSERIKTSLVKELSIPEDKIAVLPIYISSDDYTTEVSGFETDLHKKYPQFDFIALMASRLTVEKDIKTALEGFRIFVKDHSNAGLVIAGAGPEEDNLKEFVAAHNLESNVIFEPWQKVAPLYKTADVFLLTSHFEGYGLTLVEAALSGCPIISTDVGIASDVITAGANGFIIPVGDTQALTRALHLFLSKKAELKRSALQYAKTLRGSLPSWQAYIAAYKNTFN